MDIVTVHLNQMECILLVYDVGLLLCQIKKDYLTVLLFMKNKINLEPGFLLWVSQIMRHRVLNLNAGEYIIPNF